MAVSDGELLPLLRACMADGATAFAQRAQLLRALQQLGSSEGLDVGPSLQRLERAADGGEVVVAVAQLLRLLAERPATGTLPAAEAAPTPSRTEQRRAQRQGRLGRQQARALQDAKQRELPAPELPVERLPGVGPRLGQALRGRGLRTLWDLAWVLPLGYQDERRLLRIGELTEGTHQVTVGRVVHCRPGRMAEVTLEDAVVDGGDAARLRLSWFRAPPGMLVRFQVGARFRVAGKVERYRGALGITHPQCEALDDAAEPGGGGIVPRYPEVPGVAPRVLARSIALAAERVAASLRGAVPAELEQREGLPTLREALDSLHRPPAELDEADLAALVECNSVWHRRLAFEEFFVLELALAERRRDERGVSAPALQAPAAPLLRARQALGFALTAAQARAVEEIGAELERPVPMRRLLQGDVGSGKTAVAMLAAAQTVAAGAQCALMAPTEALAAQHFRSVAPLADALGLRAALLLGGARASHRTKTLRALETGTLDLLIGTHALLSDSVRFARLGLVIVDEQHRFGVAQRLRLVGKGPQGAAPHLLVMTATPIPRTLMLTLHGDLSSSVLDELPPGRIPVVTRAYRASEREQALRQLERGLENGGQAYVVCPAIDDNESGMRSASSVFAELEPRLGQYGVALLHSGLADDVRRDALERFERGEVKVLVSTVIVEVGLDVRAANVMLIEQAERFGLAQLHQLRGRVGRGGQRSACLLVHEASGEEARARIEILCESQDGFRIAEEDLRLRGPGELFGRRQSGLPGFRFGDLRRDGPLLELARREVTALLERDPELEAAEHAGARETLERLREDSMAVVKEEAG
jgi:ATP-dependent DNA helicase RecG